MSGYSVEVVADSVSPDGVRLTTMLTRYPRFIHAEMLRHRVFSHSVASSRAIPPERLVEQVRESPFVPEFNRRVKGMGVGDSLSDHNQTLAEKRWRFAAEASAIVAEDLIKLNVDKCRVNRLLEPFIFVTDLITATEWSNFFALRDHPDAQPEFRIIARMMREAMYASEPFKLDYGEWHMPLLTAEEYPEAIAEGNATRYWGDWKMISAGRCARVSYDKQYEEEHGDQSISRANALIESGHMSPFEHVARPIERSDDLSDARATLPLSELDLGKVFIGNFRGWVQMRKEVTNEHDFSMILADREVTS